MSATAQDDYALSDEPGWKDVSWGEHTHTIELRDGSVNYVDLGSGAGTPLVLLHGIGGCWQHWLSNLPRLAVERRVIALDFPGFGASPLPRSGRITMDLYARVVDDLCEQLGLGPVTLVGNSMGGLVALKAAQRFPARVEKMLLAAPAGVSIHRFNRSLPLLAKLIALQSPELQRTIAKVRNTKPAHPLAIAVAQPGAFERGLLRAVFSPSIGSTKGFAQVAANLAELSLRRQLLAGIHSITIPTLIVWGLGDQILPVADADELAQLLGGAPVVILDGTGHMPQLERPREFNRLALEFASG
jgi:pimeloyl-ACP methyl ester carboxylesterase